MIQPQCQSNRFCLLPPVGWQNTVRWNQEMALLRRSTSESLPSTLLCTEFVLSTILLELVHGYL